MHRVALQPVGAVCCTSRVAAKGTLRAFVGPSRSASATQLSSLSGRALPFSPPRPSSRRSLTAIRGPSAMLDSVKRAFGVGGKPEGETNSGTFPDAAPSWEALDALLAAERKRVGIPELDLVNGPTSADSLLRLFGTTGEPRVLLYRDRAAWCPYCQKVWLQLEEKRIPYKIEWINMRCYGDKPAEFLRKVPSGLLPAVELDGRLYTESSQIASLLEDTFPQHSPLLPLKGSEERAHAEVLLKLERSLFGRWMNWVTSGWDDAGGRAGFEQTMDEVDRVLNLKGGPYFLGNALSLVDITFAPFLERMAASLLYYKGFKVHGAGRWPMLDRWFAAMYGRETFRGIASDYYTHAHDLPPQLGGCEFNKAGPAFAAVIDGKERSSWRLPLPRLDAHSPEPYPPGDNPEQDRVFAATKMILNRTAIAKFAARAVGDPGTRRVSARLCDPSAKPGEEHIPAVDAALRQVVFALLKGTPAASAAAAAAPGTATVHSALPAAMSLAYMRDRICVPRDLSYPAARQLRAHTNWVIDELGGDE